MLRLIVPTSDKQEQQCRQMMASLDKVVSDLDKQEKAIYSKVRPPLEQNRPVQDSADRLQDLRVIDAVSRQPQFASSIRRRGLISQHAFATVRTLLPPWVRSNPRRRPKCRKPRAFWCQTQPVPVRLSSTARWTTPTWSMQRLSNFSSSLRKSMSTRR